MIQPTLFDQPKARRTDPVTSHEAAREVLTTGTAARHEELILAAVRATGGLTSGQLQQQTTLTSEQITRRYGGLNIRGFVEYGKPTRCPVKNRLMLTWWEFGKVPSEWRREG